MSALVQEAFQALQGTQATITRGWPQALVPLPSVSLSLSEDSIREAGCRLQLLELALRGSSPEAADALAEAVETALLPLNLRRTLCRDGAEKDRGSFLKLLRYERRLPACPPLQLLLQGQAFAAELLGRRRERRLLPAGGLSDGLPTLKPGPWTSATLRLRLPREALAPLEQAFAGGSRLTVEGQSAMISGYSLKGGHLEVDLCESR